MKGCFSTLIALLLVILTVLTLAAFSVRYSVFSPMYVKTQLSESNFYEVIVDDVLAEMIGNSVSQMSEGGEEIPFEYTDEEINELTEGLISSEWLQTNVESALDEMDAFLKFEKEAPYITIDLSTIKTDLSESLTELAEEKYNERPVCTESQLREMEQSGSSEMPDCRPEGVEFDELDEELGEEFDFQAEIEEGMGDQIPNEFNLMDPESWDIAPSEEEKSEEESAGEAVDYTQRVEDIKQSLLTFRDKYKLATNLMFVAAFVILVLCGILLLINMKNLRAGFRWVGIPLFISGLFVFIAAFTTGAVFNRLITMQIPTENAEIPTEAINQVTSLIGSIVGGILNKFKILSMIPIGTGTLFFGLSFLFKKKAKEPKDTKPSGGAVQPEPQSQPQTNAAAPSSTRSIPSQPTQKPK